MIYDVVRRREIEGRDKPYWDNIGMVLIEKEGKYYLVDNRTGEKYYCFERKKRDMQSTKGDFNDDIPF